MFVAAAATEGKTCEIVHKPPLTPFTPHLSKIYCRHDLYLKIIDVQRQCQSRRGRASFTFISRKKLLTAARFNAAHAFKRPMLIFTLGPYLKHKYLCLKTINLNCSCKVRFGVDVCYKLRQNNRHLGVLEPRECTFSFFLRLKS